MTGHSRARRVAAPPVPVRLTVAFAAAALGAAAAAPASAAPAVHVAAFAAPPAVDSGTRVDVSGRVAPAAPVRVFVQRRLPDGTWRLAATLRARPDGTFAGRVPLAASGNIRAGVRAADGTILAGRRRFVAVRRVVELGVQAPQYQEISGVPFRVSGVVRPAAAGDAVVLEGSRGGAFRPLQKMRLRAGGRIAGTVSVPAGGTWRFRVRAARTEAGQAAASAVTAPLVVHAANPHRVPAGTPHYIVQERSRFRIFYYEGGKLVRVFPVVFGAPGTPTPLGRYRVYSKTTGPSAAFGPLVLWYHRGYGIHGTNQEYLLEREWRYYSHGCTRNYNDNIRWLWPRVPVGTPVVNIL